MDNNFYMQVCYIILYVSQLVLKVIVCMCVFKLVELAYSPEV